MSSKTTSKVTGKKSVKTAATGSTTESASRLIDRRIKELGDWRGKMLQRIRKIIMEADSRIVEEVKWQKPSNPLGVPVWSCEGIICTGEIYKDKVKLTFAQGASLEDPSGLFNSSLDGKVRRAIDIREGETIDDAALGNLIRTAITQNHG